MKIVLLLALMTTVAMTAALECRRVDRIDGKELQDLSIDDGRDKRRLVNSGSSMQAFGTSLYGPENKFGMRQMTHKTVHKRHGGLRKGHPVYRPGSGLSHTPNRKASEAGIKGPLGRRIYNTSYNRRLGLTHGK